MSAPQMTPERYKSLSALYGKAFSPALLRKRSFWEYWTANRHARRGTATHNLKALGVVGLIITVPVGFFVFWPASLTAICLLFLLYQISKPK